MLFFLQTGLIGLVAVIFSLALVRYISARKRENERLKNAVKVFHEATDSMTKTSEELPDRVLRMLVTMNGSMFSKGSNWGLLVALRKDIRTPMSLGQDSNMESVVKSMRPELQKLFVRATLAWLTAVAGRNMLAGRLIRAQLRLLSSQQHTDIRRVEQTEVLRLLPGLSSRLCA